MSIPPTTRTASEALNLADGSAVLDIEGRVWTVCRDGGMVERPAHNAKNIECAGIRWLEQTFGPLTVIYDSEANEQLRAERAWPHLRHLINTARQYAAKREANAAWSTQCHDELNELCAAAVAFGRSETGKEKT